MLEKFIVWQKKSYSKIQKLFFDIFLVPLFFFIFIPAFAYFVSQKASPNFPLLPILPSPVNILLGLIMTVLGFWLIIWTVAIFYQIGKGTPSPFIPTQKLVTIGPYKYSRNPMYLGVILWILGLGFILNSLWFIIGGLLIPFIYLIYVKLIEEKELEARFGKDYLEYKKKVPFLIPSRFSQVDKSLPHV